MAGQVISRLTSSGGNDAGVHVISSSFYGTCSSAADAENKEVIISNHNIDEIRLVKGMLLTVKFINENTATKLPTLTLFENNAANDIDTPIKGEPLTIAWNIYTKEEDTILPLKPKWSAGNIITFIYDEKNEVGRWIKISSSNEELIERVEEIEITTQGVIKEVDVEYSSSQSNIEAPTIGWQTSAPTYSPGSYIWQRTKTVTVGSLTPSYSDPICISNREINYSSYQYNLVCSPSVIIRDTTTSPPTLIPSAITFSSTRAKENETPAEYISHFRIAESSNGTNWTSSFTPVDQSNVTYSITNVDSTNLVKCTIYDIETQNQIDTQTIPIINSSTESENIYTAFLTDESHTFATAYSAAIDASISSQFVVYKDSTQVTATITNIDFIPYEGLTVTYSDNTFTVSVNSNLTTSVAQSGTLYITATTSDNNSFEKTFNWSLASMKEEGKAGVNGFNSTTVLLYQRYFVQPSNKPQNISYNFDTHRAIIPQESLWSDSIPSGTDPCWVSAATAIIEATVSPAIDNIADTEWSDPILLVQDGKDGLSQAKITLYKRALTKPSDAEKPGNLTYTFANGSLTPSENFNGWSLNIPEIGNNTPSPCWITTGVAISAAASDVIDSWAEPVQYIEKNIYSITEYYARNNSSTIAPTNNWSTPPIPTPTQDAKYIWNYELITYTDGTTNATSTGSTVHIAATYGADGKGITGITNYYARTNTPNAPTKGTTSPWSTTPQTVDANNKYLWNYEIVNYTTGDSTETNVHLIGAYGDAGIYPTSITEEYIKTTSSTDEPEESASGWDVNPPVWESGKYIWTRSKIIWSDDNSPNNPHIDYTTPVLANSYNSIGEIAAAANETANSASESASAAVACANQAFLTASSAVKYANAAALAADVAVACANSAHDAAISAQTSASQAASAAATAQASANAAISAAASASDAAASAIASASIAFDASISASSAAASAVECANIAYTAAQSASAAAASAVACANSAYDAAVSAQTSASQAALSASAAADSASAAASSATAAENSAVSAEGSATRAAQEASRASSLAESASSAAASAVTSAEIAANAAITASGSANAAATSASQAAISASSAATSASAAAQDATNARVAADSALTQLSIIEDVAGTLDWIGKHGSYIKTTDTTVQEGTIYFEKDSNNNYTPVINPEGNPSQQNLYVLDITDSQSKYIMAHLAVTSAGLWILPSTVEEYSTTTDTTPQSEVVYYTRSGSIGNYTYTIVPTPTGNPKTQGWYTRTTDKASGYKTLLSESGMSVYDNSGTIVATYGEGISFDSNRSFTIGDESASITFDGNGRITIAGSGVSINSNVSIGGLNGAINEAINNLEIGGRNLLKNTSDFSSDYWVLTRSTIEDEGLKLTPTTSSAYVKSKVNYLDYTDTIGKTYTISWEAKQSDEESTYTAASNLILYIGYSKSTRITSTFSSSYDRYKNTTITSEIPVTWTKYSQTFTATDEYFTTGKTDAFVAGSQLSVEFAVSSSKKPAYVRNIKLEAGDKATDWTPNPDEIFKQSQKIYYRSSNSNKPNGTGLPTSWITANTNIYNTTATAASTATTGWTKKVPPLANSAAADATKYPYLWTCEQYQLSDGTVGYTEILLDDSNTIIDGGKIITGSITANQLNATNINASSMLTIGSFNTNTKNLINGANSKEQLIYIQATSGTNSVSATASWITRTAESVSSDTAGLTPSWTIKRPTYRSNYPVLFVATQRQTVDGTVTCTTPIKDDTTTIIDGGHITTGTIDASKATITNINASNITTGKLNANYIDATNLKVSAANVTGTLTAAQINTTNLHVDAANINGTITAAQINTTDLTVSAANIIGTITASQIDVTNSLTIGDLTIEARNDLVKPINEELSDLNSDLSNLSEDAVLKSKDTWTAWMDVGTDSNNDPYLTMGQSGNAFESRLTNRYMSFNEGTVELMRLSGEDGVKADIIRSKYVYIGSWILEQLDNGDMAIKLVGGE